MVQRNRSPFFRMFSSEIKTLLFMLYYVSVNAHVAHVYISGFSGLEISNENIISISRKLTPNLQAVTIQYCSIPKLQPEIFEDAPLLNILQIIRSDLQSLNFSNFIQLKRLSRVNLQHNLIEELFSDSTTILPNIIRLDLSFNLLKNITENSFDCLTGLFYLDLSNNSIDNIAPGGFKSLNSLRYLNLTSNLISQINLGTFLGLQNLTVLRLSHNLLTFISYTEFHYLQSLKEFYIDSNLLTTIDIDLFQNMPLLSNVNFDKNSYMSCQNIRQISEIPRFKVQPGFVYNETNILGYKCENKSSVNPSKINKVDDSIQEHSEQLILQLENYFRNDFKDTPFYKFFTGNLTRIPFFKYFSNDFQHSGFFRYLNSDFARSPLVKFLNFLINNETYHHQLENELEKLFKKGNKSGDFEATREDFKSFLSDILSNYSSYSSEYEANYEANNVFDAINKTNVLLQLIAITLVIIVLVLLAMAFKAFLLHYLKLNKRESLSKSEIALV